jgi:thiamine pyrophosphokinase
MRRAILFANGIISDLAAAGKILRADDFCIAVDGGARYAIALGRTPEVLLGDLDSVPHEIQESLRRSGARFVVYPADKDETDLELAIDFANDAGYREIIILGALGARLDHMLGNLSLLLRSPQAGLQIRMDDGCEEVILVQDHLLL